MDQFAVAVLADQDVEPWASVAQWHHELAAVPEGDDDATAGLPERPDTLGMERADPQRRPEGPDRRVTDRWQYRQLHSVPDTQE